jgi:hypothetical protein
VCEFLGLICKFPTILLLPFSKRFLASAVEYSTLHDSSPLDGLNLRAGSTVATYTVNPRLFVRGFGAYLSSIER